MSYWLIPQITTLGMGLTGEGIKCCNNIIQMIFDDIKQQQMRCLNCLVIIDALLNYLLQFGSRRKINVEGNKMNNCGQFLIVDCRPYKIKRNVTFVTYYKTILSYFSYFLGGIMVSAIVYVYFFKREAFMTYIKEKEKEIEDKAREKMERK